MRFGLPGRRCSCLLDDTPPHTHFNSIDELFLQVELSSLGGSWKCKVFVLGEPCPCKATGKDPVNKLGLVCRSISVPEGLISGSIRGQIGKLTDRNTMTAVHIWSTPVLIPARLSRILITGESWVVAYVQWSSPFEKIPDLQCRRERTEVQPGACWILLKSLIPRKQFLCTSNRFDMISVIPFYQLSY